MEVDTLKVAGLWGTVGASPFGCEGRRSQWMREVRKVVRLLVVHTRLVAVDCDPSLAETWLDGDGRIETEDVVLRGGRRRTRRSRIKTGE